MKRKIKGGLFNTNGGLFIPENINALNSSPEIEKNKIKQKYFNEYIALKEKFEAAQKEYLNSENVDVKKEEITVSKNRLEHEKNVDSVNFGSRLVHYFVIFIGYIIGGIWEFIKVLLKSDGILLKYLLTFLFILLVLYFLFGYSKTQNKTFDVNIATLFDSDNNSKAISVNNILKSANYSPDNNTLIYRTYKNLLNLFIPEAIRNDFSYKLEYFKYSFNKNIRGVDIFDNKSTPMTDNETVGRCNDINNIIGVYIPGQNGNKTYSLTKPIPLEINVEESSNYNESDYIKLPPIIQDIYKDKKNIYVPYTENSQGYYFLDASNSYYKLKNVNDNGKDYIINYLYIVNPNEKPLINDTNDKYKIKYNYNNNITKYTTSNKITSTEKTNKEFTI